MCKSRRAELDTALPPGPPRTDTPRPLRPSVGLLHLGAGELHTKARPDTHLLPFLCVHQVPCSAASALLVRTMSPRGPSSPFLFSPLPRLGLRPAHCLGPQFSKRMAPKCRLHLDGGMSLFAHGLLLSPAPLMS